MPDIESLIRPHLKNMPSYEPVVPFEVLSKQLRRSPQEIIKLDANENPYGPLPEVSQALAEMPYTHIYPDPSSQALRQALAQAHNVPAANLLAGAGADELIDLILRLVIEPGEAVINCPPTFGMYPFDSDVNGARVINIWRKGDFSLDIEAIEQAVEQHSPKVIFIASPNNPDGSLAPQESIERLLSLPDRIRQPALVVLDEAYIEFAPPGNSRLVEAPQRENLIVLRTFSKWAGLAGLRVGYGAFPTALLPYLWKIKQPYNVSVAASTAAIISLQHIAKLRTVVEKIIAERQRLFAQLNKIAYLQPYPSQANFILCQVKGREAARLKRDLAALGVLVRYYQKPGLQECVRFSVGKPEHTDALIQALKSLE